MAMPPLDLLPPTVAVKRVAWGVRVGRALASPAALSPKRAARPQPPHFAPVKATPWLAWDVLTAGYIVAVHLLACAAPFTYTPSALRCFVVTYVLSGLLGVTFCYHRLLSHKSFVVPKWIEYFCAYCGSLSSQSDPAEWVSFHRLVRSTAPEPRLRRPLQANTPGGCTTASRSGVATRVWGAGATPLRVGTRGKTVCQLTGGHRFSNSLPTSTTSPPTKWGTRTRRCRVPGGLTSAGCSTGRLCGCGWPTRAWAPQGRPAT